MILMQEKDALAFYGNIAELTTLVKIALVDFLSEEEAENLVLEVIRMKGSEAKKCLQKMLPEVVEKFNKIDQTSSPEALKIFEKGATAEFEIFLRFCLKKQKGQGDPNLHRKGLQQKLEEHKNALKTYREGKRDPAEWKLLEEEGERLHREILSNIHQIFANLGNKIENRQVVDHLVSRILFGLQKISAKQHDLYAYSEKILTNLRTYDNPFNEFDEEKLTKQLQIIRKTITTDMWTTIAATSGITSELKNMENLSELLKIHYNNPKEVLFAVDELQYFIEYVIDSCDDDDCQRKLYNLYSELAKFNKEKTQASTVDAMMLAILRSADQLGLKKISSLFELRLKEQESHVFKLSEIKAIILKHFKKYSGIMDRLLRENHLRIMKLHLDKFDRLLADQNDEDLDYSHRIKEFIRLKTEIEKCVEKKAKDDKDCPEVEAILAEALNSQIFSDKNCNLPKDINSYMKRNDSDVLQSRFERTSHLSQSLRLEELFHNNGQFKSKEILESVIHGNKAVSFVDSESKKTRIYQFTEDINSIKLTHQELVKEIEEYKQALKMSLKKIRLTDLIDSITNFSSKKELRGFINITRGLVFYFSLPVEDFNVDEGFIQSMNTFLDAYHRIIKYMLVISDSDQQLMSELKVALGCFETVLRSAGNRNQSEEKAEVVTEIDSRINLLSTLQQLQTTLTYVPFKEEGFDLFIEAENHFRPIVEANNYLRNELSEVQEGLLTEMMELRQVIPPRDAPETCFDGFFNAVVSSKLPEGLEATNKSSIILMRDFLLQRMNQIIADGFEGIVAFEQGEELSITNVEKIIQQLTKTEKLQKADRLHVYRQLDVLFQRCLVGLSVTDLEKLIRKLNAETAEELQFLVFNIIKLYLDRKVGEIMSKHSLCRARRFSEKISKAFQVLMMATQGRLYQLYEDFLEYVADLEIEIAGDHAEWEERRNSKSSEEFFIVLVLGRILQESTLKEVFLRDPAVIFTTMIPLTNLQEKEKVCTSLQLYTCLSQTFCSDHLEGYRNFILDLVLQFSTFNPKSEEDVRALHRLVRMNVQKYFNAWSDRSNRKDFQEGVNRLICNIDEKSFLQEAVKWFLPDDEPSVLKYLKEPTKANFSIQTVLKLLSIKEASHLHAILKLCKLKSNSKELEQSGQQGIVELWDKCPDRSLCNKISNIFEGDDRCPPFLWEEELLSIRLFGIEDFILTKKLSQNHGELSVAEVLRAFVFLHQEKGKVAQALEVLELISMNLDKFKSLYEVKRSIISLGFQSDLNAVCEIIQSSPMQYIAIDLIFHRIEIIDNIKLNNAIGKLKLVLSVQLDLEKLMEFCRVFVSQAQKQHNPDTLAHIIDLIIESKVYANPMLLETLQEKNITLWGSTLEKEIFLQELNNSIFETCRDKYKSTTVSLLYQIKQEKGENLVKKLISKIKQLESVESLTRDIRNLNRKILMGILYKSFDPMKVELLPKNLAEWEGVLSFVDSQQADDAPLPVDQLIAMMLAEDKIGPDGINAAVRESLEKRSSSDQSLSLLEEIIKSARNLEKYPKLAPISKKISEWKEEDVTAWAKEFKAKPDTTHRKIFEWSSDPSSNGVITELISVIIKAVSLFDRFPTGPRNTQIIALLLYLDERSDQSRKTRGRLANISTGEGKTLTTVMLATCLALTGKRVDIVTSSKILAIRDSQQREPGKREGYKQFFEMFDLNAGNNCDELCEHPLTGDEERKKRYESCTIIYGEASYFQRDILLSQCYGKDIRCGTGIGDVLILDEADSMMIDKAGNTLYISHNITDMRHLKDIFIFIWAAVNSPSEGKYSEENVEKIMKYIAKITRLNETNQNQSQVQSDDDVKIPIPNTLREYVQKNLKTWVESAYHAKYVQNDDAYIIGDADCQMQGQLIIMDKDTGVEQLSTKWSKGLHIFLQLKHSHKMGSESLKAIYESNLNFFMRYPKLYGMTGTIGDKEERKMMSQVYEVDFFEMPRFKSYRFEYDFESEAVVCYTAEKGPEKWLQSIVDDIRDKMDQDLPCTEAYLDRMKKKLESQQESLKRLKETSKRLAAKKSELNQKKTESASFIDTCNKLIAALRTLIETESNPSQLRVLLPTLINQVEAIEKDLIDLDKELKGKVQSFLNLLREIESKKSQIDSKFNKEIDAVITMKNQKEQELESLNLVISRNQEELLYINETLQTTQESVDFCKAQSEQPLNASRWDTRRAILIICENIADLKLVENKVRSEFKDASQNRIYIYDRASKNPGITRLEAGDIVIATNIAGRGTDLDVSEQIIENGGLHVILSYVPKNARIERQAFGRTARAGNPGTATYIVRHLITGSDEEISIAQLKEERDATESSRLSNMQTEQFPKIRLEDKLFIKFNNLQTTAGSHLSKRFKSAEELKLQMGSLKNLWAIWLNQMDEKIGKVYETGDAEILNAYSSFESRINSKMESFYGLIEEPGELNKLGRFYLEEGQYQKALDCFDYVIANHPQFAGIAYYYKAIAIIKKEGGDYNSKIKAKVALKRSLKLLEGERDRILSRIQMLNTINQAARAKGIATGSNLFEQQCKGECEVLSIHLNAIGAAIGSEMTPDSFQGPNFVGDQSKKIFSELVGKTIKGTRRSSKCVIGNAILIKTSQEQLKKLESMKALLPANYDGALTLLNKYSSDDYITFKNADEYKAHEKILDILIEAKIIAADRQLLKKEQNAFKPITFPIMFSAYKDLILDELMSSKREKNGSSFENLIYTKEKFLDDMKGIIETREMVHIDANIRQTLIGSLDHPVFKGTGNQIKRMLVEGLVIIDHDKLKVLLAGSPDGPIFFGKKDVITKFCLGKEKITINGTKDLQLSDGQVFCLEDIKVGFKQIVGLTKNDQKLDQLLSLLGLTGTKDISKKQLINTIQQEANLDEDQIEKIISHLENYEEIRIDHEFLKKKFLDAKNESIFFSKKSKLLDFCLGNSAVTLEGKTIKLGNNEQFSKQEIEGALKQIIGLSENASSEEKTNFSALLMQLSFDMSSRLDALKTYQEYAFKDGTYMKTIEEYIGAVNLKDVAHDEDTLNTIENMSYDVHGKILEKSIKIKTVLKTHLAKDRQLNKEDFGLDEEEFEILRALLVGANIIQSSIFNVLSKHANPAFIPEPKPPQRHLERESLLMRIYHAGGVVSDKNLDIIKDSKSASRDFFFRMMEFGIIKPPRPNFRLQSGDPEPRIDYIKSQAETAIRNVFGFERQSDSGHEVASYFGVSVKSNNEELDKKIDNIKDVILMHAGAIKQFEKIKVELEDIRKKFSTDKAPPEIMDYINSGFDFVLEYKEDKAFDYRVLIVAFIGVAQIAAGVALEVLTGGAAHVIAQVLIAEGVGDIVFAIQSAYSGDFSWKAYGKHKVQSLIISIVTCGVGTLMSRTAKVVPMVVEMALKRALLKAVTKTVVMEIGGAMITATVNITADELSNLVIDQIANVHFVKYFEDWIKTNYIYLQKKREFELKLEVMYNKFGVNVAEQIHEKATQAALEDMNAESLFNSISSVIGGIAKGISLAANLADKGRAEIFGTVVKLIERTVKVAEYMKNFEDLCRICIGFYDHLLSKLVSEEAELMKQQKAGTLAIDEQLIAKDKKEISFSERVLKKMTESEKKMHEVFVKKIKDGFLKPGVQSLLNSIVKPIQKSIMKPLANATEQLQKHIEERIALAVDDVKNQGEARISKLTARQKKGLEKAGLIINVNELPSELLEVEVANLGGQTLSKLKRDNGDDVRVLVEDGQVYGILPTHKQLCNSIASGNVKLVSNHQILMAATQLGISIDIREVNPDDSLGAPISIMNPLGSKGQQSQSMMIGFVKGENGKPGHYQPYILDEAGNWKAVHIGQDRNTVESCFAQTMIFYQNYSRTGNVEEALALAQNKDEIGKYYKNLGKFAKFNKYLKDNYLKGATVKRDNIIGGVLPETVLGVSDGTVERGGVVRAIADNIEPVVRAVPNLPWYSMGEGIYALSEYGNHDGEGRDILNQINNVLSQACRNVNRRLGGMVGVSLLENKITGQIEHVFLSGSLNVIQQGINWGEAVTRAQELFPGARIHTPETHRQVDPFNTRAPADLIGQFNSLNPANQIVRGQPYPTGRALTYQNISGERYEEFVRDNPLCALTNNKHQIQRVLEHEERIAQAMDIGRRGDMISRYNIYLSEYRASGQTGRDRIRNQEITIVNPDGSLRREVNVALANPNYTNASACSCSDCVRRERPRRRMSN